MITEIISWIDKELQEINMSDIFKKYYENIAVEELEDSFYLTNQEDGIGIVMSHDYVINAIHLYSGCDNTGKIFKEQLPFNLKFSFGRNKIHSILGAPKRSGGGFTSIDFGYIPAWEKYYFNNYFLHIQYSEGGLSIDLFTIGSLILEEYLNSDLQ